MAALHPGTIPTQSVEGRYHHHHERCLDTFAANVSAEQFVEHKPGHDGKTSFGCSASNGPLRSR